jgi:amino acid permease
MENDAPSPTPEIKTVQAPQLPDGQPSQAQISSEEMRRQRQIVIIGTIAGIILIALIIGAVFLLTLPTTDTAKIRDIFIIVMALESLLIGLSLIILMVQLARLINLLQNEIKPIMESTQKTVNTLQGTTAFLSDNMVEPVMKLNEYLAALKSMLEVLRLTRRTKSDNS